MLPNMVISLWFDKSGIKSHIESIYGNDSLSYVRMTNYMNWFNHLITLSPDEARSLLSRNEPTMNTDTKMD